MKNSELSPNHHAIVQLVGAGAALQFAGSRISPELAVRRYYSESLSPILTNPRGGAVLDRIYPKAVEETRKLWMVHNPMTPRGRSALYAWVGSTVGGALAGVLASIIFAAVTGTVSGVGFIAMTQVASGGGRLAGALYGLDEVEGLTPEERKDAKLYGGLGAFLLPVVGAPLGAYLGARPEENPSQTIRRLEGRISRARTRSERAAIDRQIRKLEGDYGPGYLVVQPSFRVVDQDSGNYFDVPVMAVTDNFVVHPSMRSVQEVELASAGVPLSYGITHRPTGQLVATTTAPGLAVDLAQELQALAGPGVRSTHIETAQNAIGGPDMERLEYIVAVSSLETWIPFSEWMPNRPLKNPGSVKADAAVSAAVGSLIGLLGGAVLGLVTFGAAGSLFGLLIGEAIGPAGGAVLGGIVGLPLGAFVGSIWGAVSRTEKTVRLHDGDVDAARIGAGLGAGLFGPVGAAVGAYAATPEVSNPRRLRQR